jgi:hypothetical protein
VGPSAAIESIGQRTAGGVEIGGETYRNLRFVELDPKVAEHVRVDFGVPKDGDEVA